MNFRSVLVEPPWMEHLTQDQPCLWETNWTTPQMVTRSRGTSPASRTPRHLGKHNNYSRIVCGVWGANYCPMLTLCLYIAVVHPRPKATSPPPLPFPLHIIILTNQCFKIIFKKTYTFQVHPLNSLHSNLVFTLPFFNFIQNDVVK